MSNPSLDTTATTVSKQSKQKQATHSTSFFLEPDDTARLANLCGQFDNHIEQIADAYGLQIYNRGNQFTLEGSVKVAQRAASIIQRLYKETANGTVITPELIHLLLQEEGPEDTKAKRKKTDSGTVKTPLLLVKPRGPHQLQYLQNIKEFDINFGVGPAGTGKTFLAVAAAVEALLRDDVKRILLVRPAVEAGEKLGFLPGDLAQKIDPYLRPLYDALYEMIGFEQVAKLIERQVIEIAPLAYMRGRTLNNAFIILDESQNTTREQMKMFLTRIGFGSTAVITGDVTQVDLPRGQSSGLIQVMEVLKGTPGIGTTHFAAKDVVRHPLVQRIIEAYDHFEAEQEAVERARKAAKEQEREALRLERQERLDRERDAP